MKQQLATSIRQWSIVLPAVCVLALLISAPALAMGAVSAGMGGVETALPAAGVPANPAAAGIIPGNSIYIGAGLPMDEGLPIFLSIHQPAQEMGAALSGTLSAMVTRTPSLLAGGSVSYTRNEEINYQIAEQYKTGYAGIGLRYLRQIDESNNQTGEAWRVDLGWQQPLAPGLVAGVTVSDVAGSDLRFSNGSIVARRPQWRLGLAYSSGTVLTLAADVWQFTGYKPGAAAIGLEVAPLPRLFLRGGYRWVGGVSQYTAGAGVVVGGWQLDVGAEVGAATKGILGLVVRM